MVKIFGKIFIFALIFSLLGSLWAENFRVRKVSVVNLPGDSVEEQTVTMGINDGLAVFMPSDTTYLEGIEFKVQIPSAVADWRDSVAFSIYDGLNPVPAASQIDYFGTRVYVTPLPAKLSWIAQIPLKEKNSIRDSNYITKVPVIPNVSKGFSFFRFQPAMKGVPDSTYLAELGVSVKPILMNKGMLHVSVYSEEKKISDFEVYVDDEPVVLKNGKVMLSPGSHNVNIQSESYRSEVRTVYVDQAKTTDLKIGLKSTAPTIVVTAPKTAEVYLDSERFYSLGSEVTVSEGEHVIRCLIGGYEMVRNLVVEKGKSYKANLTVDLEISEE